MKALSPNLTESPGNSQWASFKAVKWVHLTPFPRWHSGIESACQYRRCKRHSFDPWVRKIPCRRKWKPILAFLPEKSTDRRIWRATVHGSQSQTRLNTYTNSEFTTPWSLRSLAQAVGECRLMPRALSKWASLYPSEPHPHRLSLWIYLGAKEAQWWHQPLWRQV